MKDKLLNILSIVLVVSAIATTICFVVKINTSSINNTLQTEQTEISTSIYTQHNTTPATTYAAVTYEDIENLEMELAKYSTSNDDTEKLIANKATEYINARYNYEGTISENYSDIITKIDNLVAETYLPQVKKSMNTAGGNFVSLKNKKVRNYCSAEDIYITSDTYDDGSKIYMTAVLIKVNESLIRYHQISFAQYEDGSYLINYDNTLNISYAKYDLEPIETQKYK